MRLFFSLWCKILGLIAFFGGGVGLLGFDVLEGMRSGVYTLEPLGERWFQLDEALGTQSLGLVQVALERHLWAPLWSHGIFPLLQYPAPFVLAGLGLVLILIGALIRPS